MPNLSSKVQPVESKTYWFEVILLWIAGVSAAMQFAKFSISYDAVLIHYQEGPTATGAALSIVGVVGLIFGVSAGVYAGRIGYRKVLVGALLLGSILSFIQSFLPPFELILITRLLEGFSQLGVVVAAPTMIARLSADRHRSITMGLWGTFFGVAFAVSGFVGKWILVNFGLSALYLSHAILIGFMALLLTVFLHKNGALFNTVKVGVPEKLLILLSKIYRNPRIVFPSFIFLFYTCILVSMLTYIPRFIQDESLKSTMQVLLPLISTAGSFIAGALSQYFLRPQRVALIAYVGTAINALILLNVLADPTLFCFVVGVMIFCIGMLPGATLAMIPILARNQDEQAQGYGLVAQLGNLGATVGPPSFATVITLFGMNGLIGLVLTLCCFGVVFSLLCARIGDSSVESVQS